MTEHDIEACHRLPTRKGNRDKPVILKLVNRKSTEKAIENVSNLNNMDLHLISMDVTETRKYFYELTYPPTSNL